MKTSIKIILATAIIFLMFVFISVLMFRNDVKNLMSKQPKAIQYEPLKVKKFEALSFSGPFKVIIRQGSDCKVNMSASGKSKPKVEYLDNELNFSLDSAEINEPIYVKVTMPILNTLNSDGMVEIQMEDFTSDSLEVKMSGGTFKGFFNTIKKTSYNVSGETQLLFKNR